jgi:hypothetical protein
MNWTLILTITVPLLLSLLTVAGSAWMSRLSGRAAIHQAATDERRQASADWEAYTGELRRYNDGLTTRLAQVEEDSARRLIDADKESSRRLDVARTDYTQRLEVIQRESQDRLQGVERRLGDSEIRAQAAEIRATRAESLYSVALVYLRRLSLWVTDHVDGVDLPPPPPELHTDLGG